MLFFQDSTVDGLVINRVGNKLRDEFYVLYDDDVDVQSMSENVKNELMNHLAKSFTVNPVVYHLFHPNDSLALNEVYQYAYHCFSGEFTLKYAADLLTHYIYETSNHPKLNAGRFYVAKFKGVQFEGEECEAIGIYKEEDLKTELDVIEDDKGCSLCVTVSARMIGFNQAALILNRDKEKGFCVVINEGLKGVHKQQWLHEFLHVKARNDDHLKTSMLMKLTKSFVADKLDETFEVDQADKADLMNRSFSYFKERDTVDMEEFGEEIFGPKAAELFSAYIKQADEEMNVFIGQAVFGVSSAAVKKQQASFKQVIKLDRNFHLYVHGKRDLLEKGYDEEKGMNYYKVFFENEG